LFFNETGGVVAPSDYILIKITITKVCLTKEMKKQKL
jgi:hypothetical protein